MNWTALKELWADLQAWFAAKGGFTHWAAGVFATGVTLYFSVPQFHALIASVYAALPGWAVQVVGCAVAIYAWYRNPNTQTK